MLPIERGLAGYVAVTGQLLAIDRPADDPRFAHDVAQRTGLIPTSMLLVPVSDERGDVVGVLSVLDRAVSSADALGLATAFADHLATLIPAARRTADQARVLLSAVVDAARRGTPSWLTHFVRRSTSCPGRCRDRDRRGRHAAVRATDPATRRRAVALIGEVVELATAPRRR